MFGDQPRIHVLLEQPPVTIVQVFCNCYCEKNPIPTNIKSLKNFAKKFIFKYELIAKLSYAI